MPASHSEVVVRIELVHSHELSHSAWHTVRAQEMLAYVLAAVTNDVFLPKTPAACSLFQNGTPHTQFCRPQCRKHQFSPPSSALSLQTLGPHV